MQERGSDTVKKRLGRFLLENPAKTAVGAVDAVHMPFMIVSGRPEAIVVGTAITALTLGAATIFDRRAMKKNALSQ